MAEPPVQFLPSRHFLSWLHGSALSLAFTTYQTNRLFLIGQKPGGGLSVFERHFERPMGLWASPERLYMSTQWQIWQLDDALPPGEEHRGHDRLYVPRRAYTTGDLDVHDIAVDRDGRVVFVNTAYSCLATLSERLSFKPIWKPPFVSRLFPEDRCHLNGLALAEGEPAYVTAVSRSDVATGWRDRRHTGGCVIDVEDDEIVLDDLSMPHSPRVYQGKLWLLNSGTGELGFVDRPRGRFEPIAFCPGFLRGLTFAGDFAIVGLSKQRKERTFSGLALDDRLKEKDGEARCGLWVIDLKSGAVAHWLEIEGVVTELYDVQVLPGVRRPMALGFRNDEIQRLITIDVAPKPLFQALAAAEPAAKPRGNPSPAVEGDEIRTAKDEYAAGNAFAAKGRFEEAIAAYRRVIALEPRHVNAILNLGTCQARLGREAAAEAEYRKALDFEPKSGRASSNLAALLQARGKLSEAARHLETALEAEPQSAALLNQLGLALYHDGRIDAGKAAFGRCLQAHPDDADALNGLAAVLQLEQNFTEALSLHERAAEIRPSFYEAVQNIGKIHEDQGRIPEAKAAYRRAAAIREDPALALHRELLCPPVFPSTAAIDAYRALAEGILDRMRGKSIAIPLDRVQSSRCEPPFDWSYQGRDNLSLRRKYAALFAANFSHAPLARAVTREGPWRIGFVVTAAHEGVFARSMGATIDRLAGGRFHVEVHCSRPGAAMLRGFIKNSAVRFRLLPLRFDHAAESLRAAALDALYFWEVGTDATNYFLPFLRLAPLQSTGWGWPDTAGAPELDVHLSSEALAPRGAEAGFAERLVRLEGLPANFPRAPIPETPPPLSRFGLPDGRALYVCAQTLRKIHPDFDDLIGRILRADRNGVAVFVNDKHEAPGALLRERWRQNVPDVADRIVMLPRLSPEDYFALLAHATVALDPLYFGGCNTTYDAFAAGVPVVTLPSPWPRGRYTAALCRRARIDECVVESPEEYVTRAVELGTDRARRNDISARIHAESARVFDDPNPAAELAAFFGGALSEIARRDK